MLALLSMLLLATAPDPVLADVRACSAARGVLQAAELSLTAQAAPSQAGLRLEVTRTGLRLSLGLPRLRLGWVEDAAVSLRVSVTLLAQQGCTVLGSLAPAVGLVAAVPVPESAVALRYRPWVRLSLLTPYLALLNRLGTDLDVHGRVAVSVGVGTTLGTAVVGTRRGAPAGGGSAGAPVAVGRPTVVAPSFRAPVVSLPGPVVVRRDRR
ncbi:MAG: hypothetical protein HY904_04530 [Deltaproteobacteria bacterium]|nr:hypothetical protein [Deltaproteobacteria bacterium]